MPLGRARAGEVMSEIGDGGCTGWRTWGCLCILDIGVQTFMVEVLDIEGEADMQVLNQVGTRITGTW